MKTGSFLVRICSCLAVFVTAVSPTSSSAQEVFQGLGGPMNFDIGYGVMSNPDSSMSKHWVIANDVDIPVTIDPNGYTGIETNYLDRGYRYVAQLRLKVTAPVTAVNVVIIPFDVWNQPMRSLSLTKIRDFPEGTHSVDGQWNVFDENDALGVKNSFAYVDRVRLTTGAVIYADRSKILAQAQKISSKLEEQDIAPPAPKKE